MGGGGGGGGGRRGFIMSVLQQNLSILRIPSCLLLFVVFMTSNDPELITDKTRNVFVSM